VLKGTNYSADKLDKNAKDRYNVYDNENHFHLKTTATIGNV
jgi:hypothetical protein